MSNTARSALKFGIFVTVMLILTACVFVVFGQYRTGSNTAYSAVFKDASSLKTGDSVRVLGVRVGTVTDVALQPDNAVIVSFDTDRSTALTAHTRAAVRYLNLVGDRYLELIDTRSSNREPLKNNQITSDHTAPALDLDQLLGGIKPVIQGLNPRDVNALSASLIQIFQGQGDTIESLFSQTSSFTNALADNSQIIQQLIDNLNDTMATFARDSGQFSGLLDRLHRFVGELAAQRDLIGSSIESLSNGTASLVDLLGQARHPLAATINQLSRLAPNLDAQKDRIDTALGKAPENYRKLARIGAYGAFLNYYVCGVTIRVSDLDGRTAEFPWFKQETGRCAEP